MRAALGLLLVLLGCRDTDRREAAKPPIGSAGPASAEPIAPTGVADPWQVADDPDSPPDLGERHRLADRACPAVTGPYFYRIEKGGKVSHILGTRHIGVSLTKFPPVVIRAIETAKLAVFEVAPDDDTDLPMTEIALRDELGPDLWSRYQRLVGDETAKMLERGSPSAALLSMMVMYEDISAMLDSEIETKVLAAGVPARGLERSAFQDKLLDKLLDIRLLRASIQHTDDRKELAEESRSDLAEYCAGTDEVPGMDADMRADLLASGYTKAELDSIDEEMVYKRNADWIPKLEKIMAGGDVFIAVGADHLTGPRGVAALLEKRGYKVTRVTK